MISTITGKKQNLQRKTFTMYIEYLGLTIITRLGEKNIVSKILHLSYIIFAKFRLKKKYKKKDITCV